MAAAQMDLRRSKIKKIEHEGSPLTIRAHNGRVN